MLNSNRQSSISSPTAGASQGTEAIDKWSTRLSGAEIRKFGEALVNQNAAGLARFYIRFIAWQNRSGASQPC